MIAKQGTGSGCGMIVAAIGLIGSLIAIFTFLTGIVSIQDLPKLTRAPSRSTAAPASTEIQHFQPSEDMFTQDFNGSDSSYDHQVWVCTAGSCDDQNMFQQNGTLVFKFTGSDLWGGIMRSQAAWKPEDLVSIEGKLRLGANTRGGAWLGIDSQGWQGVEKGGNCSISVNPEDNTPHIGCNIGPDGEKEYLTPDQYVEYDTWYSVRIDFDPVTQEQTYYVDGELIGQYLPKISTNSVSAILGVWRDGDNLVEAYIDDIIVTTKP